MTARHDIKTESAIPEGRWRTRLRRIGARISIITIVIYVAFFLSHMFEYFHTAKVKPAQVHESSGSSMESMHNWLKSKYEGLGRVNPRALADVYSYSLVTTNCDWLFQCEPIFHRERSGFTGMRTRVTASDPQLFYHLGWIIYIPTLRTIHGTPYALWETVKAIRNQGFWVVAMFLSCTVIWLAIVVGSVRSKEPGPMRYLVPYLMVLGAVPGISFMVAGMQWMGELVLEKAGSGLGLLVEVLAHSSALALLVSIPHVFKAPREVKEALELLAKVK